MNNENVVSIKDLRVNILTTRGVLCAVRGIDLDIRKGEIHGFVGESGCGKTTTAKAIMRLYDEKRTVCTGEILLRNNKGEIKNIFKMSANELRMLRGKDVSMVFQDPMVTLNPLFTVGRQIEEILLEHLDINKKQAREKAIELLDKVGIKPAEVRYKQYPFEFSGGMLQRIIIAIAISCNPELVIADESTTALDVTIQAQILDMMKELQRNTGMSMLLITHNFGVVAEICDRASVMYAGKIVETSDVKSLFRHPLHPYTKALIESIPKQGEPGKRLVTIQGTPPSLLKPIKGCAFAPRCSYAQKICYEKEPEKVIWEDGHEYFCHLSF